LNELARQTGGAATTRPEAKDQRRVKQKIATEFDGDAQLVTDLLAGRITFDSISQLYQALFIISNEKDINIVRYDDRFLKPQWSGYRDIILKLRLKNGHVAELRLELTPVSQYSTKVEHALYEVIRQIKSKAKHEKRELTPDETLLIDLLTQQTQKDYENILWNSRQTP